MNLVWQSRISLLYEIVISVGGRESDRRANLGSRTSAVNRRVLGGTGRAGQSGTQRAPHAHIKTLYNKPEVRKRITGSTAATEECRLNIQRATANPNAA